MAHLAEISNLSVSHISKVENAQCEIGLKALLKISTALGMEVTDFLPYDSFLENQRECKADNGRKHEVILTNGERFEEIVQGASPQSVEFILKMTACMRKVFDENVSYKKK